MLHPRFLTTCVLLPALLIPLILDWREVWLIVMLPTCMILSVYELSTMLLNAPTVTAEVARRGAPYTKKISLRRIGAERWWKLWLIASCLILYGLIITGNIHSAILWVGAGLWFMGGSLFLAPDVIRGVHRLNISMISVVYGCLSWLSIWYLFQLGDDAHKYMIFIIAVVMGSDTGGFIGGKLLGRHTLAPEISPNKTWEGAVCAIVFATVIGGGYGILMNLLATPYLLLMSVAGAVAAMVGDLVESVLKRYAAVKDSGSLFPGHGGFLDRADGFIVAIPILWLFFKLNLA